MLINLRRSTRSVWTAYNCRKIRRDVTEGKGAHLLKNKFNCESLLMSPVSLSLVTKIQSRRTAIIVFSELIKPIMMKTQIYCTLILSKLCFRMRSLGPRPWRDAFILSNYPRTEEALAPIRSMDASPMPQLQHLVNWINVLKTAGKTFEFPYW